MLVELAIGDAYGAGFEYVNRQLIQQFNDLSYYHHHPRHKAIQPGMYTDDTQMSIAVAEIVITDRNNSKPFTREHLAERFVRCFKRDPRTGYASSFYGFLKQVRDGADFLATIRPTSDKSGAAMRAGPVGVYPTIDEVLSKAELQAAITHDTPDGIAAAQGAALMTHYFLYDHGPKAALADFLAEHVPSIAWYEGWDGKVKSKGWMSTRAAVTALMRNDSLADLLVDCVNLGGDVDTVATIAMAAASCSHEYERDIPQHLVEALENGPFGRDYLQQLDERLLATM